MLKECQDIQLRCGANLSSDLDTNVSTRSADVTYGIQAEKAVSAHVGDLIAEVYTVSHFLKKSNIVFNSYH